LPKWLKLPLGPSASSVASVTLVLGAVDDLHGRVLAAHIGLHVAGMCGIDLDVGVAQLVRQTDRPGIQRGLRGVVGRVLGIVDR